MRSFNLLPDASTNLGSLQKLQFLPVEDVLDIEYTENVDQLQVTTEIETDEDWFDALGTQDEYYFECTQQGDAFLIRTGFFVPKLNVDDEWNFEEMKRRRYIVIAVDNNHNARVCGSLEAPMMFTVKSATGSAVANRNGSYVEWTGVSTFMPPFLIEGYHYYYYGGNAGISGDLPKQASITLHFAGVPTDGSTLTIHFPETDTPAHDAIFRFKTIPTSPSDIDISSADVESVWADTLTILMTILGLDAEPITVSGDADFEITMAVNAGSIYDGTMGNTISLEWSNVVTFEEISPVNFEGGYD